MRRTVILITNKDAIRHIEKHKIHHGISSDYGNHPKLCEALDKAIEALKKEESSKNIIPPQEVEFEFNLQGFKMDGEEAVGMVVDRGFTLEFRDKDGKPIPLNQDNVKKFIDMNKDGKEN